MRSPPDWRLSQLRWLREDGDGHRQSSVRLRWLRTYTFNCSEIPLEKLYQFCETTLALQSVHPYAVDAVDFVVPQDLDLSMIASFQQKVQSFPHLTVLNLRGSTNELSSKVLTSAAISHPLIKRLYLSVGSLVEQSTLDHFTQLVELDVTLCQTITNVDFCSGTLRVLYANYCDNLSDIGLQHATRLEILHSAHCNNVTKATPFAHCLLELDASWNGFSDAALSECRRLQVLLAYYNNKISTLQPFARRLRELSADLNDALGDEALASATSLVRLSVRNNSAVTTVAPFGSTLRELDASEGCGIHDEGLSAAVQLTCLNASGNERICSVTPFGSTLLELDAMRSSALCQEALIAATELHWLDISDNNRITSVAPCATSLRHIVASGVDCSLGDSGLAAATNLVSLDCSNNPRITTISFCANTLQQLIMEGNSCGLKGDCLARAAQLRSILIAQNPTVEEQHLEYFELGHYDWYFRCSPL